LQHAAGLLLFEKVRAAGLATLGPSAPDKINAAVKLAVDSTMYALMKQIDGVTGGLRGNGYDLALSFGVERTRGGIVVSKVDLRHGDGAFMGFHYWLEGNFGEDAVIDSKRSKTKQKRNEGKGKRLRR
jgi:hypothetical protein